MFARDDGIGVGRNPLHLSAAVLLTGGRERGRVEAEAAAAGRLRDGSRELGGGVGEHDIPHPSVDSHRTIVSLADLGDGRTELCLDVTMVCVEGMISGAQAGWNGAFDKLAAALARD